MSSRCSLAECVDAEALARFAPEFQVASLSVMAARRDGGATNVVATGTNVRGGGECDWIAGPGLALSGDRVAWTAEAAASGGAVRGTFASNDYSQRSFALEAEDVNTAGLTTFTLRSTAADTADRSAWSPAGPDYSSTYREGFVIGSTVRLVVAVEFDYHA